MKEQIPYFGDMMYSSTKLPPIDLNSVHPPLPATKLPMIHTALRRKIGSLCPVSDEIFHTLNRDFKPLNLSVNQLLFSAEQIPDRIFFIQKGLLRGYYMGEKEPVTTWFAGADQFIIPNNFFSQEPCNEYIQSLEDCSLLSISHHSCLKMALESNDIAKIFFKLLEEKQLLSDGRERMLRIPNAEKRYLSMIKLMPALHKNVKDDILASYMNVTRRHLERIKIKTSRK
ncbi:Crp/Fnr family transcriptional regulator [Pedobacter caeni]|uniref:cAMP-binding domain of CRP or a regulatory subunit of cAMP-dependent protein kinases n=1 Tax=Pedobacter caeni TaxID=288992 RepID=A0A1M5LKS5_9SPHI|nr:Crp/Fnr family transcriptional regulator [Pedobacter caeni]SHG64963.1 cAMP-binding domain of CRP or a regulatory subunit of cAMP-dependent protein kinases [Pedobacter caeni]